MNGIRETERDICLSFFGKINASISHEIKNVLAVINENAGLMKDMYMMAEKGRPLDHERMSIQVEKILAQIRRADRIVDNMNRFAHSIDKSLAQVDLSECLEFVIVLSERFAAMRGVTLELVPPSGSIEVRTSPFLLENIIYLCLEYAMEKSGEGKNILININKNNGAALIKFSGLASLGKNEDIRFQSEGKKDLISALGASIEEDADKGEVILMLPEKTDD